MPPHDDAEGMTGAPPQGPRRHRGAPAPPPAHTPRALDGRGLALIALFGGSLLLALAASGKSFNYHEARYAQGAREMLERGSWLVPTIGERPRLQKPPLVYWSMATAMAAFGSEREWPARLPSVAASVLVAILVADLAARRLGPRLGLLAGLAQASSVYVLVSGQLADPDMLLTAAVTAGMWSFARGTLDAAPSPRRFALGFWGAAGLAFLVKGPIGPALFVPAALLFAALTRRRASVAFFFDPRGLALFALLVVAWPLAAYLSYPGILDAWLEENVSRFRGELGRSSPLFYLYTAPWMVLPWTPFAIVGAVSAWREPRRDAVWGLSAAWLGLGLAILSASAGKHDRYLAPILPPVALLAGRGLLDVAPRIRRRPAAVLAGVLAAEWVIAAGLQQLVAARFDAYGPHRDLARRLPGKVPPQSPLLVVAVPNNVRTQLLYYVRQPAKIVDDPATLRSMLASDAAEAWILTPAAAHGSLTRLGTVEVVDRAAGTLAHQRDADRLTLVHLRIGAERRPG